MATNRILAAIERTRTALQAGVRVDDPTVKTDPAAIRRLEKSLDNSLSEHFAYQSAQARAHAMGRITTDEALTIYAALGEAPAADGWAAGTDLATKIIVTEVMSSLVAR